MAVQLENELTDDAQHLLDLKQLAQRIGFTVPLYTVTGWNSRYGAKIPVDDVLPVFGALCGRAFGRNHAGAAALPTFCV